MKQIPVVTSETLAGYVIIEHVGLVRGNTVRARHVGRDILAGLRNLVGGELGDYTKLMAESREQAIDRMLDEAHTLGADAIVGVRFSTSMVAQSAAEILVFGSAVKVRKEET